MAADPLVAAITAGDVATVRALVREDPTRASARDGNGLPVVLLALFHQQREAADALLEAGADPNMRQRGGFVPLHEAAHSDDAEMARLLLAHGADPSIAAEDGRDSVRIAADDGSAAVASLLA
jgi:ankyrin repeat protein